MKKLLSLFLSLLFVCFANACQLFQLETSSTSDSATSEDGNLEITLEREENMVIITVVKNFYTMNMHLDDIMQILKTQEGLSYEIENGLLTSLDGVANTNTSFWMLYTSYEILTDTAWGTIEYKGNTYGSAIVGAEGLPAVHGQVYIWSYETPSW